MALELHSTASSESCQQPPKPPKARDYWNVEVLCRFEQAQPLNILYASRQIGNLQIIAGPTSINQTLHNVLSGFPIGHGLNLFNYGNQFIFENSFASFQDNVSRLYINVTLGALYMNSNISIPILVYVGDFGILPAMLIQNLWTQNWNGLPIASYYTPFDSRLMVSPPSQMVEMCLTLSEWSWKCPFCTLPYVYASLKGLLLLNS
jgi:hypothetical protein